MLKNMNTEFFKPFPSYEDVFYDDIENHKKYFLPICSVNLKFLYPERDEWFHFVSVKEIYVGQVGENTQSYHTQFTKFDMLGFDVIDGKYKFDASWDYFYINHKKERKENLKMIENFIQVRLNLSTDDKFDSWANQFDCTEKVKKVLKILSNPANFNNNDLKKVYELDLFDELEIAYQENEKSFELQKNYFNAYNEICPISFFDFDDKSNLEAIKQEIEDDKIKYPDVKVAFPEFFSCIDDLKFQSKKSKELMKKYDISLEEMQSFENTNLLEKPLNQKGEIFEYIGSLTGYEFQKHGADCLYLFHDNDLKKAVICLEYT